MSAHKYDDGAEKLAHDLAILEAMAAEMDDFLTSDAASWPLHRAHMPQLTLGGYLMRQLRLAALFDSLTPGQQGALQEARRQFQAAIDGRPVRVEQRAHDELGLRLRQWVGNLEELRGRGDRLLYATLVEPRAMVDALIRLLEKHPFRLNPAVAPRVATVDRGLRARWQPGEFIWPDSWQPAYPRDEYWWLYGAPR